MFKNVASQTVTLFATDASTGLPKTGDSANMVFYVSKDDGTVTAITASSGVPTQVDSTNDPGSYKIALAQAETNADKLRFSGKSSTTNVVVVPQTIYTVPPNFTALSISSGKAAATMGSSDYSGNTVQTGDAYARIGAAGASLTAVGLTSTQSFNNTGQTANIPANTTQFLGHAVVLDGNNYPGVNIVDTLGSAASSVTMPTHFSSLAIGSDGVVQANLVQLLATALTETTGGNLAAAFKKFLDVVTPTGTLNAAVLASTQAFDNTGQTTNLPANAKQFLGHAVVLDGNNYPGVNIVDINGSAATGSGGIAQGGSATGVELSATDPYGAATLTNWTVEMTSGPSAGQSFVVLSQSGSSSTRTLTNSGVTLSPAPASGDGYLLRPPVSSSGGGDPWATAEPGSYSSGTFGHLVVTNLDAAISSRSTFAGGAVASVTGNVGGNVTGSVGSVSGAVGSVTGNVGGNVTGTVGNLAAGAKTDVENAVWNGLHSAHTTSGTFGLFLDAAISGISGGGGSDPWATTEPGSYGSGTFGHLLATTMATTVSHLDGWLGSSPPSPVSGYPSVDTHTVGGATVTPVSGAVPATLADKTGFKLAPDGVDLIVVETGVNLRQAQSPILAASAGVVSGAGTGVIIIKGGNVTTTRITATTSMAGDRTSVTLALPT